MKSTHDFVFYEMKNMSMKFLQGPILIGLFYTATKHQILTVCNERIRFLMMLFPTILMAKFRLEERFDQTNRTQGRKIF